MRRAVHLATLALVLLTAGCPEDQSAGTGPLADGYLAKAKSLERALERLDEQLKSADEQLAAGSAHVSFEPLPDRDLAALVARFDLATREAVDNAHKVSRELEAGLDDLSKTPAREKPSAEKLGHLRSLTARAAAAARAARERVSRFIARWS